MKTNQRSQKTQPIADASPFAGQYGSEPTPEEIAMRAYELHECGGSQHGDDVEHWLAAEAHLIAERSF